ncbi:uncharacterized protein [Watersipora subatra]|uniref:uncharacterized protein n=1 Tax=Watersipora subatra TaxID=2589382 RepID=UPI00355BFD23
MGLKEIVTRARAVLSSNSDIVLQEEKRKVFLVSQLVVTTAITSVIQAETGQLRSSKETRIGNLSVACSSQQPTPETTQRLSIKTLIDSGCVTIRARDKVTFGCASQPVVAMLYENNSELKKPETDCLTIEDAAFKAVHDGTKETVVWKWKSHEPELKNQCAEYAINTDYKGQYSCEIEQWISNGWLEPHDVKVHGNVNGLISLMAVFQSNKGRKVRPVMDYSRKLNKHVNSNPGNDVAICQQKLRQLRSLADNVHVCMLDLKKAYLQLHLDSSLQRFQAVRFNGQLYVMTRLGFGLNVTPKIMFRILAKVLSMDEEIAKGTNHYIDDIVVNKVVVLALKVKDHLQKYGLLSKEPESQSSARVLGWRIETSNSGTHKWSRDSELPEVHSTNCKRSKVNGHSEMLVKRRLNLLNDLISEYQLVVQITLVKFENNKADELTRAPHKWLKKQVSAVNKDIEEVVKHCLVCKRVDSAPAHWETGQVYVERDWYRLATDITHYQGTPYLTVIDCGPSRFAIWRKLRNETSPTVMEQLDHIFCERGSPVEILSGNGPCYRSFQPLVDKWCVHHIYSCAYRASGNEVIERNHHTINRMLSRSGGTVNDMLYWYNNFRNADGVVPFKRLFNYNLQKKETTRILAKRDISLNPHKVGDQVYLKPGNAKCTSVWKTGKVTSLVSNTAVKVDDMTRHIGDTRFCWRVDKQPATLDCELDIANTNTNESTEGLVNFETPLVTKQTQQFFNCS